jgi:hypothetical protein
LLSPPPGTTILSCLESIASRLLSSIPFDYLSTPFSSFHRSPATPLLASSSRLLYSLFFLLTLFSCWSLILPPRYIYFEKRRIAEGKKKTAKRLRNEQEYGSRGGMPLRDGNRPVWVIVGRDETVEDVMARARK